MPTLAFLLPNALLNGVILCVILSFLMAISMAIAPDMWVNDYPPDIREKFGAMTPKAVRLRRFIGIPFFAAILMLPFLAILRLAVLTEAQPSFLAAFATAVLVLFTFNLFDLLVIDWLVFVFMQPKRIVLPGTEGMAGYRDYAFHFKGFLIGTVFCLVGALFTSGVWALLGWLIR